jgi:hypothetical protein
MKHEFQGQKEQSDSVKLCRSNRVELGYNAKKCVEYFCIVINECCSNRGV